MRSNLPYFTDEKNLKDKKGDYSEVIHFINIRDVP